ncbi:MAG: ATP-binding protein [Cyclonatronaceae bacterium]
MKQKQLMTKESQIIELKQTWRDEYLKWVCGFANALGGRIYIGVDDDGHVVGVNNASKLLEDLPNKIRDHLGLMPHVNLLQDDGKSYIEIIVEPSNVPISLRGSYYWRSGSVKQELKGQALNDFLMKKMGMSWDRAVEEKATLQDIDEYAIEYFRKDAARAGRLSDLSDLSDHEVLKKLRLLTRDGLTRAAIVLFGKNPGEFYPNLFVKIGRFGTSDVDLRFQEVCEGNLIQMLRDVMEQLEKKFLIKPVRFEGIQRIEELEYPVAALREMLLNALVHRNYFGSMTQMKVYNDTLTLWNAGTLPEELSIEKLFQVHESIPRNPLIAEVCYRAGYIDSWGRGIQKIADSCKDAGLPPPAFSERSGGVLVTLTREQVKTPVKTQVKTPVETQVKTPDAILMTLKNDPSLTLAEVAHRIGKSVSAVERAAKKLGDQGKLKYIGPQKGGHWEVQE